MNKIEELKAEIIREENILRKMISEGDKYDTYDKFEIAIAPTQAKLRSLDKQLRMIMPVEFIGEVSKKDNVMTINEFISAVKLGTFTDYDGYGAYIKDGKRTNIDVLPTDVKFGALRKDFDSIVWFNK